MRTERREGKRERRILTGMITNRAILARIAGKWNGEMFTTRWANMMGRWCVKFYERHQDAPKAGIEAIFDSWAARADEDEVKLCESFLSSLSGEYEERERALNPGLVLDQAEEHFQRVKLLKLRDDIDAELSAGSISEAQKHVNEFSHVQLVTNDGVDPFDDMNLWREAFESQGEPVITYPGAVGKLLRDRLERDGFISFMAPEKTGKSWLLMDVAVQALFQRRKVAFFEAGDLSRDQLLRRLAIRFAGQPNRKLEALIPKKLYRNEDDEMEVEHELRKWEKKLNWRQAWKAAKDIRRSRLKTKEPMLKLSVHPNDTLSAIGIESQLRTWQAQDWEPDVIVIDYADILAPPPGYKESRDQINSTWKRLRSISQQFHCLVVTATQTDAASYDAPLIRRAHFSEDKRKFAHVTGMLGINQNPREKELGLMGLNWVLLREDEYIEGKKVWIAGCLSIGRPIILSEF